MKTPVIPLVRVDDTDRFYTGPGVPSKKVRIGNGLATVPFLRFDQSYDLIHESSHPYLLLSGVMSEEDRLSSKIALDTILVKGLDGPDSYCEVTLDAFKQYGHFKSTTNDSSNFNELGLDAHFSIPIKLVSAGNEDFKLDIRLKGAVNIERGTATVSRSYLYYREVGAEDRYTPEQLTTIASEILTNDPVRGYTLKAFRKPPRA